MDRVRALDEDIERVKRLLESLGAERSEVWQAIQVYDRFDADSDLFPDSHAAPVANGVTEDGVIRTAIGQLVRRPKPRGIPSVPKMITEALREAAQLGLDGLEPKAITDFIRHQYWPDAPINSVGPTAWRLWTEGRLRKHGEALYSLPEDETPTVAPAGVSERGESDVTGDP